MEAEAVAGCTWLKCLEILDLLMYSVPSALLPSHFSKLNIFLPYQLSPVKALKIIKSFLKMLFSGYKTAKSFKSNTIVIIVLVGNDVTYAKTQNLHSIKEVMLLT